MKLQCVATLVIATKFTSTAFVAQRLHAESLPSLLYCSDKILPSVSVTSCVSFHTPPSQPHALPLSYRGMHYDKTTRHTSPGCLKIFIFPPKVKKQERPRSCRASCCVQRHSINGDCLDVRRGCRRGHSARFRTTGESHAGRAPDSSVRGPWDPASNRFQDCGTRTPCRS